MSPERRDAGPKSADKRARTTIHNNHEARWDNAMMGGSGTMSAEVAGRAGEVAMVAVLDLNARLAARWMEAPKPGKRAPVTVQQARWQGCAWLALSMLVSPRGARALNDVVYVQVGNYACPDALTLRSALSPLLGESATVQLGPERGPSHVRHFAVRDEGAAYLVEIDDKRREIQDPARDCAERARVAAVFIALNVNADDKTPPAPIPPPPPVVTPKEPSVGIALRAYGSVQVAGGLPVMPGIGLGASLEAGAWNMGLDAFWLASARDDLKRSDGVTSRVAIMRVPWTLRVGHHLSLGALSLGPALGVAIDVLQLRGEQVTRPQRETRVNVGVSAGLDGRLSLGQGLRLLVQASLAAFPRAYRLAVDPLGTVGRTPAWWFGGQLGLEWAVP